MRLPGRRGRRDIQVVVYTRRGCGLCRRAEEIVRREARGAEITIVDVDSDAALRQRYDIRVPVVAVDGVEVAELEVQPGEVRRALRTRTHGRPR